MASPSPDKDKSGKDPYVTGSTVNIWSDSSNDQSVREVEEFWKSTLRRVLHENQDMMEKVNYLKEKSGKLETCQPNSEKTTRLDSKSHFNKKNTKKIWKEISDKVTQLEDNLKAKRAASENQTNEIFNELDILRRKIDSLDQSMDTRGRKQNSDPDTNF